MAVVRVGEPGLRGERVGVQPVQQLQIHAHTQHGILGRVEVHVRKGLHQQPVAVVPQLRLRQLLRQHRVDAPDHAILQHHVAPLQNGQLPHFRRVDDIAP